MICHQDSHARRLSDGVRGVAARGPFGGRNAAVFPPLVPIPPIPLLANGGTGDAQTRAIHQRCYYEGSTMNYRPSASPREARARLQMFVLF